MMSEHAATVMALSLSLKYRLPSIAEHDLYVDAGGLISYGASLSEIAQRLAVYVDKILKGAKPADLPVEQPTRFSLAINMKTAKALGIKIPQSLLIRADKVIE
jgi:putative ABC transport system substrate-binding protein